VYLPGVAGHRAAVVARLRAVQYGRAGGQRDCLGGGDDDGPGRRVEPLGRQHHHVGHRLAVSWGAFTVHMRGTPLCSAIQFASVADPGCLSWIQISSVLDPGSASKNLCVLTQKNGFQPLGNMIPDPDPDFLPIPGPGSEKHQIPDPDLQHCSSHSCRHPVRNPTTGNLLLHINLNVYMRNKLKAETMRTRGL
jgi:hypothetical protein